MLQCSQVRHCIDERCCLLMLLIDAFIHADKEAEGDADAASRLISHLIKHLLKGFSAKDKTVRFRSTQFVAVLITGLGELEWV